MAFDKVVGKCPKNCKSCPIWKKSLFRGLRPDELSQLEAEKESIDAKRWDVLFQQGDAVKGLYCIADGLVRVQQAGKSGKARFVRFALPADTVGHRSVFIEEKYKGTSAVISDEAHVCFIPYKTILSLLGSNPAFARDLIQKLGGELDRSEEDRLAVTEKTVRGRLARLILSFCDDFSSLEKDGSLLLKSDIAKTDLARVLCVADETVIRLMSEFKKDGVITYTKRRIRVLDLNQLRKLSTL
jgi:CRP/FNR family transcriptional regulator